MEFKEFRKILSMLQKAMVERGISFNESLDRWCPYRSKEADEVLRKTTGLKRTGGSWRTNCDLWVCENVQHSWTFKDCHEITYEEIKYFCVIHDIINIVPPEVYGEKTLSKYHVSTEVEFMDI